MPIFYKITKDNKTNYLLGTTHFQDPDYVTVPLEIKEAFEAAQCFVLEADPLDVTSNNDRKEWLTRHEDVLGELWTFKDITKISGFLGDALLSFQLLELLKLPPMELFFDYIHPRITETVVNTSSSLDHLLHTRAMAMQKKIVGLEKIADLQTKRNALQFSYAEQVELFQYSLKNSASGKTEEFKRAYLAGELEKLVPNTAGLPAISVKYTSSIIDERDTIQVNAMEPSLLNGDAFVAIGGAHIPGVISKLSAKGFRVEAVQLGPRLYEVADFGLSYEENGAQELINAMDKKEALLQAILDNPKFNPKQQTEQTPSGSNALIRAIYNHRYHTSTHVKILLDHKQFDPASLTQCDAELNNALMIAIRSQLFDVASQILNHPKFPLECLFQRNDDYETVFQLAQRAGDTQRIDELFSTNQLAQVLNKLHQFCNQPRSTFFSTKDSSAFIKKLLTEKELSLSKIGEQLSKHLQDHPDPNPDLKKIINLTKENRIKQEQSPTKPPPM